MYEYSKGVKLLIALCIIGVIVCLIKDAVQYAKDEQAIADENNITIGVSSEGVSEKNWLTVLGTDIDYAVVQGTDNSYYLTHDNLGNENESGSIFLDYRVDDNSDNAIIYGHNRVSGTQFGTLSNLMSNTYYDKWGMDVITLTEEDVERRFRVFTVFTTEAVTDYLQCNFETQSDKEQYIRRYSNMSEVVQLRNVTVDTAAKLITLSTCSGANSRLVVMGYEVSYEEKAET